MDDVIRVLLDWHILLMAACLLVVFPLVFYLSSLDKTPVTIRKVRMRLKKEEKPKTASVEKEEDTAPPRGEEDRRTQRHTEAPTADGRRRSR